MMSDSPTQTVRHSARIRHDTASRADRLLPALLVLAALLAGSLVVLETPTSIRLPVVLLFLAMGPGFSMINLLGIADLTQKLVLSLSLSIALDTIVAGLALYAGLWSPTGIMLVLVGITVGGAGVQLRFTPSTLGFVGPAGAEPSPGVNSEQPYPSATREAQAPAPGEALTPAATDKNGEPANDPVIVSPHSSGKPTHAEIGKDIPPGRLARVMFFIGLIGGCIMLIARTSRRSL